ncbi:MAG: hypothetical protein HZB39_15185 [Planctomycetes bacterium]|nr:hypothetical protein [Planctomycetota bacterium]
MFAIARVWAVFLGGVLSGAGILLHAQIACLHLLREEVNGTFVLWRWIGGLTFVFQDDLTQAALWAEEVPDAVLRESDHAAWALIALGALCVVMSFFVRPKRRR